MTKNNLGKEQSVLLYNLSTSQFKSSPGWEHVKLFMSCTNKEGAL